MMRKIFAAALLAIVAAGLSAWAQEGHPLAGTWHGEWKNGNQTSRVVLFMQWDGKSISGVMNPGPGAVPLKVTLEPKDWMVHIEGGNTMIDGKIEEIGKYNRKITGTIAQGQSKAELKLTRD
jgi:hypothetical protein